MNDLEKQATKPRSEIQPACSISEQDGTVSLHLEMPGVNRDRIEISVENNELVILGKNAQETPQGTYLIRERHAGDYRKRFIIDETIDRDNIQASMADGILRLVLATKESAKPRKIEIK
jgi:HSP20 family protein